MQPAGRAGGGYNINGGATHGKTDTDHDSTIPHSA